MWLSLAYSWAYPHECTPCCVSTCAELGMWQLVFFLEQVTSVAIAHTPRLQNTHWDGGVAGYVRFLFSSTTLVRAIWCLPSLVLLAFEMKESTSIDCQNHVLLCSKVADSSSVISPLYCIKCCVKCLIVLQLLGDIQKDFWLLIEHIVLVTLLNRDCWTLNWEFSSVLRYILTCSKDLTLSEVLSYICRDRKVAVNSEWCDCCWSVEFYIFCMLPRYSNCLLGHDWWCPGGNTKRWIPWCLSNPCRRSFRLKMVLEQMVCGKQKIWKTKIALHCPG